MHSKLHVQKTQHIRNHHLSSCLLQAFLPWACTSMALRPHLPMPQVSSARHWMAWWQPPAYMQKSCCSCHPKAESSCASIMLLALQALPPFQSVSSSWRQACLASASSPAGAPHNCMPVMLCCLCSTGVAIFWTTDARPVLSYCMITKM